MEISRRRCVLSSTLAIQPNHYNSLYFLAERLAVDRIHRWPEAVAYMTACVALRPDHIWAYINRAGYHEKLGQLDEAEADYSAAISRAQSPEDRFIVCTYRWRFYRFAKRRTGPTGLGNSFEGDRRHAARWRYPDPA